MIAENMNITELQAERDRLQRVLGKVEVELNDARCALKAVQEELARRTRPRPNPRLSDHALMRYFERIYKVDLDKVRAEIMTPAVISAIEAGAKAVIVNGLRMPIENYCIVTVLDESTRLKRKTPKSRIVEVDEISEYFEDEGAAA